MARARPGWVGPVLVALALFWGTAAAAVAGLGIVLAAMGPVVRGGDVKPAVVRQDAEAPAMAPPPIAAPPIAGPVVVPPVVAAPVVAPKAADTPPLPVFRAEGAAVAGPDPALLEPASGFEGARLPRIGPGGLRPSTVYAAGRAATERRPRIAIVMADIGPHAQASEEAIRGLPAPVSFAVSPYGVRPPLLDMARERGHELFAVVPMEPANYPNNDPGPHALLTGAAPLANARNLEWALSRFEGYVGVTGVLNRMHGERFANAPELYATMLEEVARRGLLYLDARPGGAAPQSSRLPPFRAVDLVLDAPAVRGEVDERLTQLERIAREGGTAVGLAEGPSPMVIDRIAAWATALPLRGYALVPASALVVAR